MDKKTFELDGRVYVNGGEMKVGSDGVVVYTQQILDEAVSKLTPPGEIKSGFDIINKAMENGISTINPEIKGVHLRGRKPIEEMEGGFTRQQMQLDYAFNSRYGSMGSGNTLFQALTTSLSKNLERADVDSWIITAESCKKAVKEILDYDLVDGYDNIPKEVIIGALRPYVWLDNRTDVIPEKGYNAMEFLEFLKGMFDIEQLREMDPIERKGLLNSRVGAMCDKPGMKRTGSNALTSECRLLADQTPSLRPDWFEEFQKHYPEGINKGSPVSRVAIIGGNHIGIGQNTLKQHLTNVAVGVLSDMHISYPFGDIAEVEEDKPQTVKGNGRQLIVDNGNGKSWPAAKGRKGHRKHG